MEGFDWKWALAIALWSFMVFRVGFALGKLARGSEEILPLSPTAIPPEVRPRVSDAMQRGEKIEAIRLVREATGCGLAVAKKTVEAMGPPKF